jgi:hypothetical protein
MEDAMIVHVAIREDQNKHGFIDTTQCLNASAGSTAVEQSAENEL